MIEYINPYWGQFYIFDNINYDDIDWEWDFLYLSKYSIIFFEPEKEF